MPSTEPCGSLPVVTVTSSAHFCEHHQAWSASTSTWRMVGEEDLQLLSSERASFGPFDSWEDVSAWLVARLVDPSGLPT